MNKIVIEVSSEDGTLKHYVINCKKLSASDAVLKTLKIADLDLEPAFQSEIFEYKAALKFDVCNLKIDSEVEDSKCEVLIAYNGVESVKNKDSPVNIELNFGHSKIEIIVKSPNRQKTQVNI
jgi:primase-polymerase (primpol)-like protein